MFDMDTTEPNKLLFRNIEVLHKYDKRYVLDSSCAAVVSKMELCICYLLIIFFFIKIKKFVLVSVKMKFILKIRRFVQKFVNLCSFHVILY
jgi:hypothetical protein